jgi:hypothetical protein
MRTEAGGTGLSTSKALLSFFVKEIAKPFDCPCQASRHASMAEHSLATASMKLAREAAALLAHEEVHA